MKFRDIEVITNPQLDNYIFVVMKTLRPLSSKMAMFRPLLGPLPLSQVPNGDELGEITVTDKADFTLSSGGQLCCLTDLFLLCFAFTSFIFFFCYLGHRHVAGPGAGLGSLTSSLSACARVYGDTRLRSLPADSGSDWTCLTLEQFTVTRTCTVLYYGRVSRVFQPCPRGVS